SPLRLPALRGRCAAHGGVPDVEQRTDQGGSELEHTRDRLHTWTIRDPGTLQGTVTPKRDIDALQREIQELFSDLWQVPRFSGLRTGFRPHVDCYRTNDALTLGVELPGVDPQSVDLFVRGGTLYIPGERVRPRHEGQVYQQMELDYGPFRRQVALNADVDVGAAKASYEHGILEVVLPLAKRPAPTERVAIVVNRS